MVTSQLGTKLHFFNVLQTSSKPISPLHSDSYLQVELTSVLFPLACQVLLLKVNTLFMFVCSRFMVQQCSGYCLKCVKWNKSLSFLNCALACLGSMLQLVSIVFKGKHVVRVLSPLSLKSYRGSHYSLNNVWSQ